MSEKSWFISSKSRNRSAGARLFITALTLVWVNLACSYQGKGTIERAEPRESGFHVSVLTENQKQLPSACQRVNIVIVSDANNKDLTQYFTFIKDLGLDFKFRSNQKMVVSNGVCMLKATQIHQAPDGVYVIN